MHIERIKRRQWMVIGLVVGLAMALAWRGVGPGAAGGTGDLLASADVIGSQALFESMLLRQDGGVPRFRELVVHRYVPRDAKDDGAAAHRDFVVTGRLYQGPADSVGRALCFEARSPYQAGAALARVEAVTKTPLAARYHAIQSPTIVDYLSLLSDAGVVDYEYAWWELPYVMPLIWAAAGVLVIGGIWPTVINVLVYHRLTRPREEPATDLSAVSGTMRENASNGRAQLDEEDLAQLDAVEAGLRESLAQSQGETEHPQRVAVATVAPIAQLSAAADPLVPQPDVEHGEAHFHMKPKDFYPTAPPATAPAKSPAAGGFTLVELLVAMAIIIVLIGILVPVLSSTRKSGQQVKCASNLRQIGAGLELYSQVNHELPEVATPQGLSGALIDLKSATEPLFHCPSDETGQLDYSMSAQYAGLPKSAGKASEVLASESGARHFKKSNALYFDGHVELSGK